MRHELLHWIRGWRGLAQAGIAALGLTAIVGSGGGGQDPICEAYPDACRPPPPPRTATIEPSYVTALVGTPATYTVQTTNVPGPLTYQWRRSSDGGRTYVDIAGATGPTYSITSVNLADDGVILRVDVPLGNGIITQALAHLAVSATPGVVFEDHEFLAADWLVTPFGDVNEPAPAHTEDRVATGGNPGAYRRMVFQLPQQALAGRVFYTSLASVYQPQTQGAIYVIDYAEDCIALTNSTATSTDSSLLLEQAGRRYLANNSFGNCASTNWTASPGRASLAAQDFRLINGLACQMGESCPDFSAQGPPMRFGYWRISFGVQGDSIPHGIDNWKVTVWRR